MSWANKTEQKCEQKRKGVREKQQPTVFEVHALSPLA